MEAAMAWLAGLIAASVCCAGGARQEPALALEPQSGGRCEGGIRFGVAECIFVGVAARGPAIKGREVLRH